MAENDNMENKEGRMDPVMAVIEDLRDSGYKTEFFVKEGKLHDREGHQFEPTKMQIDNEYRFEGPSNPDDMSILYAISNKEGTKGYISNAYGTYADTDTDDIIKKMNDNSQSKRDSFYH